MSYRSSHFLVFSVGFIATVVFMTVSWSLVCARQAVEESGWEQTAGPLGGTVIKMLTINGVPFASLYSGGVYAVENDRWKQMGINHGLPENRAFDLITDPNNTQIIYSAMMIACGAKSVDGGATWTGFCDSMLADLGIDNFSSDTLALDPNDSTIIYMAGHADDGTRMFIESVDGGDSWQLLSTFDEELYFNHLVFFHDALYLCTRSNGVYRSTDRGVTWDPLNTGLTEDGTIRFAIDASADVLYVATGLFQFNVRSGGHIYQLSDDETRWNMLDGPDNVTGIATNNGILWVGTEDGEIWRRNSSDSALIQRNQTSVLPADISEFAFTDGALYIGVGGYGIYRSTDNGETFTVFNRGLKSIATRETHLNPKNAKQLYVLTWDRLGVYYSGNRGGSYTLLAPESYMLSMGVDSKNFRHIYGGANLFYEGRLTKNRQLKLTERTAPGPEGAVVKAVAVDPHDSQHVLAGVAAETAETSNGYGLYYSLDAGVQWKKADGIPNNAVYSIIFHPRKPRIVYASALGGGVYKSTDGGRHFSRIGGDALTYTYRLSISSKHPNIILAGSNLFFAGLSTEDQTSGQYGGVFRSLDGGEHWTELTAGIRDYDGTDDPDGFQVWMYNLGHLPNYEQMLVNPNDPDNIFVGHHGENVVVTTDGGATWQKPTVGMIPGSMHNYAYCLNASKTFRIVYACTCGRGLFSGAISSETKTIAWDMASSNNGEYEHEDESIPRTAVEAQIRILSGIDEHDHIPMQ